MSGRGNASCLVLPQPLSSACVDNSASQAGCCRATGGRAALRWLPRTAPAHEHMFGCDRLRSHHQAGGKHKHLSPAAQSETASIEAAEGALGWAPAAAALGHAAPCAGCRAVARRGGPRDARRRSPVSRAATAGSRPAKLHMPRSRCRRSLLLLPPPRLLLLPLLLRRRRVCARRSLPCLLAAAGCVLGSAACLHLHPRVAASRRAAIGCGRSVWLLQRQPGGEVLQLEA